MKLTPPLPCGADLVALSIFLASGFSQFLISTIDLSINGGHFVGAVKVHDVLFYDKVIVLFNFLVVVMGPSSPLCNELFDPMAHSES